MKTLPAKSFFTKKNIDFVLKNFKSILQGKSFLSQYKFAEEFEKKFSNYVKSNYAISCNSGTSALELIFRVIGVNKKEVIIPSNTFLSS